MKNNDDVKLGPTHRFPQGRIHQSDDGELAIAIAVSQGKIIVEFGVSTKWIGFGPREARELARLLNEKADQVERSADA